MSKPIRIRGFVADPVAVLAEAENRSFANMVEVLLLAALTERGDQPNGHSLAPEEGRRADVTGATVETGPGGAASVPRSVSAAVTPDAHDGPVRPHMKKHRPAVECPTRWPAGVCPDCGQVVT